MAVLDTNPAMTTASVVVLSRRGVESKGLRRGLEKGVGLVVGSSTTYL